MNRADFQKLAEMRLDDAKTLLDEGKWSAAYYLAGYAVECGLKACIIAELRRSDEFREKRFSEKCWSHDLEALLQLAGLESAHQGDVAADAIFGSFWGYVNRWSELSRYQHSTTEVDARTLYEAIAEPTHGVLQWIKKHW